MINEKIQTAIAIITTIIIIYTIATNLHPELDYSIDQLNDSNMCIKEGGVWNTTNQSCSQDYGSFPLNQTINTIIIVLGSLLVVRIAINSFNWE